MQPAEKKEQPVSGIDKQPLPPGAKEPLLLPRGNGLGWTLNFNHPAAYIVLAVILGFPFCVVLYILLAVR